MQLELETRPEALELLVEGDLEAEDGVSGEQVAFAAHRLRVASEREQLQATGGAEAVAEIPEELRVGVAAGECGPSLTLPAGVLDGEEALDGRLRGALVSQLERGVQRLGEAAAGPREVLAMAACDGRVR